MERAAFCGLVEGGREESEHSKKSHRTIDTEKGRTYQNDVFFLVPIMQWSRYALSKTR